MTDNFHVTQNGQAIERVKLNGVDISLLAGGDGVEVILHHLAKGHNWYMVPDNEWSGFEYLYIIEGELACIVDQKEIVLNVGDSVSVQSVQRYIAFSANQDTKFLYISSQPVFQKFSKTVYNLATLAINIEEKDGFTSEHCKRIRDLALLIGRKMELDSYRVLLLHNGSFFHDLGKTKIPDVILGKPGKFSIEEYELMKQHAKFGYEILMDTGNPVLIDASTIVLQHHERFNGSGYPYGLKGDEISIEASIVAVVDSFDAMVTNRVYSKARTIESAVQEIKENRGILYNPIVVDFFMDMLDYIKVIYNQEVE